MIRKELDKFSKRRRFNDKCWIHKLKTPITAVNYTIRLEYWNKDGCVRSQVRCAEGYPEVQYEVKSFDPLSRRLEEELHDPSDASVLRLQEVIRPQPPQGALMHSHPCTSLFVNNVRYNNVICVNMMLGVVTLF